MGGTRGHFKWQLCTPPMPYSSTPCTRTFSGAQVGVKSLVLMLTARGEKMCMCLPRRHHMVWKHSVKPASEITCSITVPQAVVIFSTKPNSSSPAPPAAICGVARLLARASIGDTRAAVLLLTRCFRFAAAIGLGRPIPTNALPRAMTDSVARAKNLAWKDRRQRLEPPPAVSMFSSDLFGKVLCKTDRPTGWKKRRLRFSHETRRVLSLGCTSPPTVVCCSASTTTSSNG